MFNTKFWRISWSILLMIGSALWSVSATAQGCPEAQGSPANSAQVGKQFVFEVVSIHRETSGSKRIPQECTPDEYRDSLTLEHAIRMAYLPYSWLKWSTSKTMYAPSWVANDIYDIDARVAPEDVAAWQQAMADNDLHPLLSSAWQAILMERCKLALHLTTIEAPYLNLMVDKHGAKLKDTVPGAVKPVSGKTYKLGNGFYIEDNKKRQFVGVSMEELIESLIKLTRDYPVQDKTGLTGRYDFTLPWYDPRYYSNSKISNPLDRMPISSIGLMLKPGKGPESIINIDHIEKPSPN